MTNPEQVLGGLWRITTHMRFSTGVDIWHLNLTDAEEAQILSVVGQTKPIPDGRPFGEAKALTRQAELTVSTHHS